MSLQRKPKRLQSGARIGIVNPASWLDAEKQKIALTQFENLGYEIVLGQSTKLRENCFAGTPEQRASDLMAMFADKSIDAIICGRGGYGANRVLPLIDFEIIKANPKIFVGYSDITALLCSISQEANLVTFHGPMLSTFADRDAEIKTNEYNLNTLIKVLSGEQNIKLIPPSEHVARSLKLGVAEGPLWGGNLCLIIERLATKGQLNPHGGILFIEDIDEELYAFERMMLHLKNSGSLEGIKGLVIGEMVGFKDGSTPFGKTVDEIVLDVCEGLDIPIVSNFPCGHGGFQATLPVSHSVELHVKNSESYILISESAVS